MLLVVSTTFGQTEVAKKKTLYVRRNVKNFSQKEIDELIQAILAMKKRPSLFDPSVNAYDYFPKIHWEAINGANGMMHAHGASMKGMSHIAHENPGFLPWHREFLRRVEVELRISTGKPDYTLPYWDWTDRNYDNYLFSANFMGGNGDPKDSYVVQEGAFGKKAGVFKVTYQSEYDNPEGGNLYLQRHFGSTPFAKSLPNTNDVIQALKIPVYDLYPWNAEAIPETSFRQFLEGFRPVRGVTPTTVAGRMHGQVHIFVGGHLLSDASPNDPLFFLHHCNVDRIFAEWQDRWGLYNFPRSWQDTLNNVRHTWQEIMEPFNVTLKSTLDIRGSGVRYDTQGVLSNVADITGPMTVFPNPTADLVEINLTGVELEEVHLQLLNSMGTPLQSQQVSVENQNVRATMDLEAYQPGIYFISANSGKGIITKKVIRQ